VTSERGDWLPNLEGRFSIPKSVEPPGAAKFPRGGTVFTEPVLVVNQLPKVIEVSNEYAIFDQNGRQLAAVRQVGQNVVKKAVRALTRFDRFFTHRLQLVDMTDTVLLTLTRPRTVAKSRITEHGPAGAEVGAIVQQNLVGAVNFALESGGRTIGSINAENWYDWDFSIRDDTDTEVARVGKSFSSFVWDTKVRLGGRDPDNYVVRIHRPLPNPLRELVVAAALSIDAALKQGSR
jgi:hypothetical protein